MTDEEPVEEVVECPGCVVRRVKIELRTGDGTEYNLIDIGNASVDGADIGSVGYPVIPSLITIPGQGGVVLINAVNYIAFKGKCKCAEEECVTNVDCALNVKYYVVYKTLDNTDVQSFETSISGVCGEETVKEIPLIMPGHGVTDAVLIVTFTCTLCGTENTPGGEIPVPGCC